MSTQAGTLFFYNAWRAKLDANYDYSADTFKVMLVESGYTPDLNHSNTTEVSDEVTGYTQQTCLNVKFEIINALHNFDCDNVVFSPSSVITPRHFVVYKENGIVQELVCFGLLNSADQDVSVGVGGKLTINFGLFGATGAQGNATPHSHTESDIVDLDKYTQAEVDTRIQALTTLLQSDETSLDSVQEIVDYIQLNREDLEALTSQTFEHVSKNLNAYPYQVNYNGDEIGSIVYTTNIGEITKTFNYSEENLSSIVLSGDTPNSINLTKTLTFTGDNLTNVSYS